LQLEIAHVRYEAVSENKISHNQQANQEDGFAFSLLLIKINSGRWFTIIWMFLPFQKCSYNSYIIQSLSHYSLLIYSSPVIGDSIKPNYHGNTILYNNIKIII